MDASPGRSLWSLIADHAEAAALPRIRAAVGRSLVDLYTEVFAEADLWRQIWREAEPGRGAAPRPLPDPPVGKELLRAEVKMLLHELQESAGQEGRDEKQLLSRYKQKTVDYALGHGSSSSSGSPGSSSSSGSPGSSGSSGSSHPQDAAKGSRPSPAPPAPPSGQDLITALKDQLTAADIDQVVQQLRSIFTEESRSLITLIDGIKGNLIQQRSPAGSESEPSLAELRELRDALQADLDLRRPSSAAFLRNREQKRSFRSPAGQSFRPPTRTSISKPHLLSALPHKPKPPSSPAPSKTSTPRTGRTRRLSSAPGKSAQTGDEMNASAPGSSFPSTPAAAGGRSVGKHGFRTVQEAESPILAGFHLTAPPTTVPT